MGTIDYVLAAMCILACCFCLYCAMDELEWYRFNRKGGAFNLRAGVLSMLLALAFAVSLVVIVVR